MKKRDLPKPKFDLGAAVIYQMPSEGNLPPRRDVGKICAIDIRITADGYSMRYHLLDKSDQDGIDESSIVRRVVL